MPNPEENKQIEWWPETGEPWKVEWAARSLNDDKKREVVNTVKRGVEKTVTTTTTTKVEEVNFWSDVQFEPLDLTKVDTTRFSPQAQRSIQAINGEYESGTTGKINRLEYTRAHYKLPYNQVSLDAMKSDKERSALWEEMQRVLALSETPIVEPWKLEKPEDLATQQKKFVLWFHVEWVASPKLTDYVSQNPENPFLTGYNAMLAQGNASREAVWLQCNQMLAWDRANVARQRLIQVVGVSPDKVAITSTAVRELEPGVNDSDIPGVNIEGIYGNYDQTITTIDNVTTQEVRFNDQMDAPIGFINLKSEMREQLKEVAALPNLWSLDAIQWEQVVKGYLTDGYWIWSGTFQDWKLTEGKITKPTWSGNVIIAKVSTPWVNVASFLQAKKTAGEVGSKVDTLLAST